jgi:predicted house-cleaning noncanonical NTP pyrophosphatase (MazG superfamily)
MSLPDKGKLVRDKIPDIIRADSREPETVLLGKRDFGEALLNKVNEEFDELLEAAPEEKLEEFADVVEVLRAYAEHLGIDWQDMEKARLEKAAERGGFSGRVWLL